MQGHQRVLEDILALMWIDDRLEEEASDRGVRSIKSAP
jgi:hypothetical protein